MGRCRHCQAPSRRKNGLFFLQQSPTFWQICYTINGDKVKKIIVASTNPGKIAEYRQLLADCGYEVCSLLDYPLNREIKERGMTFFANASLKAEAVAARHGLPVIADDSGLEVEALGGKPGVRSKRYSRSGSDDDNNHLLLKKMQKIANRRARFVCCIVYYDPTTGFKAFTGTLDGEIARELKYGNGFGYDPLFFIPSLGKWMSELTTAEKNQISHRAVAFQRLRQALELNR